LEIDDVSFVDSLGNTFSGTSSDSNGTSDADSSSLKMQLEEANNNKIRNEVLATLTPFFGADNVKVSVNCTVDLSYTEQNSTDVHMPTWAEDGSTNGAGIIGSRVYSYTWNADDNTVAEGVGTGINSDLPSYVEDEPQANGQDRLEGSGTINYDNSRDQTYTVRTAGYITDCTVAVSINETTAGYINVEELRQHVANAAGITPIATETMTADEYLATKISVLSMPFYNPTAQGELVIGSSSIPLPSWMPPWALYAAIGGLILFLILLFVILMLVGKRKKKKKQAEEEAAAAAAVLAASQEQHVPTVEEILAGAENIEPVGADVMTIQTEKSLELRKSIRKFAEENPELAAQMIKTWLRGGEENG
jgi:flagellar M-ring protein FliF